MPSEQTPASMTPTEAVPFPAPRSAAEGRFVPGTILGARYRITGLLGKGGMGEVYRATDLKLDQAVALKFLREVTSGSPQMLARFHNEVRTARQVTHPNVCRVYDIGEVDGLTYLSMEYVDGEDLASLLRRIGRLPYDKGLEIARKLCAGLAAAHSKGVLHRDLKPANVMIDSRGQVLITDFGLAEMAEQVQGAEVRNGTPAYMAPEQLAGREVSVRSDIYALGLVLYEIFTGKRPFDSDSLAELRRLRETTPPPTPASWVKDLDPAVAGVILRCLAADPNRRPATALTVASALPGGDPLQAALAAGETPSPELVAASGESEGLRPAVAVSLLSGILVGLVGLVVANFQAGMLSKIPMDNSPEVLALKARDFAAGFGYKTRVLDRAYGFRYDQDYWLPSQLRKHSSNPVNVADVQPSLIRFWYRESPQYLEADRIVSGMIPPGRIKIDNPAPDSPGMIEVSLDPDGRLLEFHAVPSWKIDRTDTHALDWTVLFAAAGLDQRQFRQVEPEWNARVASDARAAWTGVAAKTSQPLRVEAAGWRGKPVYFQVIAPWTEPGHVTSPPSKAALAIMFLVFLVPVAIAAILARHNFRLERSDRDSAFRAAVAMLCLSMAVWVFGAGHTPTWHEVNLFVYAAGWSLVMALLVWVLYTAIEPYVRRRWPHVLISTVRALGRKAARDPLVARDVLGGIAYGIAWALLFDVKNIVDQHLGQISTVPTPQLVTGLRAFVAIFLFGVHTTIYGAPIMFLLVFMLRIALKRWWLASSVFVGLFFLVGALAGHNPLIDGLIVGVVFGLGLLLLIRFGLLAWMVGLSFGPMLQNVPATSDLSVWYAPQMIWMLVGTAALAVYAFYRALAGRPVLGDGFLQP